MGVLITTALLFRVYSRATEFWKLPYQSQMELRRAVSFAEASMDRRIEGPSKQGFNYTILYHTLLCSKLYHLNSVVLC